MKRVRVIAAIAIMMVVVSVLAAQAVASTVEKSSSWANTATGVATLTGKPGVTLIPAAKSQLPSDSSMSDMRASGTGESFWVEKKSGKIRAYFNPAAYEARASGAAKSAAALDQLAEEYVRKVYPTDRLARMKQKSSMHSGGQEADYQVQYREYVDGIPSFNYVRIVYSDDGQLLNCQMQDEDVTVGIEPVLAMQDAIKITADKCGWEKRASESAELEIVRHPDGSQHLVWAVVLTTGDAEFGGIYTAEVDATTGEVVQWATSS